MDYQQLTKYLCEIGQQHILDRAALATEQQRTALLEQVNHLDKTYPGGLSAYVNRARKLLADSKNNVNPYEGYTTSVPHGINLDFYDAQRIDHYQTIGIDQLKSTAFVLVAGGLGQRLGYKGIKVQIPIDTSTHTCFLKYYIEYILAFQHKHCPEGHLVPLAIMTSDDTKTLTEELLQKNNNFGLKSEQLTIMKQQKVPSMLDNDARFALQSDKLLIETKPHGHGDVHTLLYQHGLTKQWQQLPHPIKWLVFFQDTNPLIFRSIVPILGVSSEQNFEMNSVGVRRRPGEAVGAITKLTDTNSNSIVINVEYNQLEGLLKSVGGEATDDKGFSVYPGNINVLVFHLPRYHDILEKTGGNISEFINPKYADNTKTKFKSAARLECMMQDYPKLLSNSEKVGFTMINREFCFSTVKNDIKSAAQKFATKLAPESASSCQADFYWLNRELLRICGAQIEEDEPVEFSGIRVNLFPRIYLAPRFGVTLQELRKVVKHLKVSKKSTLIIQSQCVLEHLELDGTLSITQQGVVEAKQINQIYKKVVAVEGHEAGYLLIRGYKQQQ